MARARGLRGSHQAWQGGRTVGEEGVPQNSTPSGLPGDEQKDAAPDMSSRLKAGYAFALIGFGIALLALVLRFYPGTPSNDLLVQYAQAQTGVWTDRHPPMGVAMMAALLWTGHAIGAMFVLQNVVYGVGLAMLSAAIRASGRPVVALLALAAGLSPLILFYNTQIYADVTVYALLILATAWTAWYRLGEKPVPIVSAFVIAGILILGMTARANAVFAVGPLFLYLIRPTLLSRKLTMAALSIAIAGAGIAGTLTFNRYVAAAERSGFDDALPFYDLMGIARYSGDVSGLPAEWHVSLDQVRKCYTPHYWDPFTLKFCDTVFQTLPPPGTAARAAVKRVWLQQVVRHPLAYAEHRLKHFDAQLNWIEPPLQCQYAPLDDQCGNPDTRTGRPVHDAELASRIRQDYLKKNPVTWPVTWLVLAIIGVALSGSVRDQRMRALLLAAFWSAIFYAGMYLFVGIAANIRYFLWTTLVSGVFGVVLVCELIRQRYPVRRLILIIAGVMALVWLAGYAARLGDWAWFIN